MPRPRRIPRRTDPQELAALYKAHLEWVNLAAQEVAHRFNAVAAARLAGFTNYLASLGWVRASGQYFVLRALYFAPDRCMRQNELAEQMNVTSANMTRLIDALEERRLVSRTQSPTNRKVELTASGEELCSRLVPEVAHYLEQSLACFSNDELLQFNDLLRRLQAHMETLTPEPMQGAH